MVGQLDLGVTPVGRPRLDHVSRSCDGAVTDLIVEEHGPSPIRLLAPVKGRRRRRQVVIDVASHLESAGIVASGHLPQGHVLRVAFQTNGHQALLSGIERVVFLFGTASSTRGVLVVIVAGCLGGARDGERVGDPEGLRLLLR